ncbi:MAG: hypothetical protein ABFD58_01170 [Anaerolineaceae bacterium]
MDKKVYDPEMLLKELLSAGLPAVGASSAGRCDFERELNEVETLLVEQVRTQHQVVEKVVPALIQENVYLAAAKLLREKPLPAVPVEWLVAALWQQVIEGKPGLAGMFSAG